MTTDFEDRFTDGLHPRWQVAEIGHGLVTNNANGLRLTLPPLAASGYSNAQITDYRYSDMAFAWRPPLRLTVTARASGGADSLRGTAGFGFWNHPFSPDARQLKLPRAVWFFFSSPPSDMRLAMGVNGPGWKVGTIDAGRWQALSLAPTAPLAVLLMRVPSLYNSLWPRIQRALAVSEFMLDAALLTETHTYTLDWRVDGVTFAVDETVVHDAPTAPRGPLGLILWMDNQYAVVTPQGKLRFGVVEVEREQWLMLQAIKITA